jgi:signal transduction histidine kinase
MSPVIGMRHLLSRHVIYRGDVVVVPGRGEAPGPPAPPGREALLPDVLPYGMLTFCVLVSYSLRTSAPGVLLAGLIISVLTAAWMLWMFTLHPAWRRRPRTMAVFITVLIVLGALLILDNTLFGLFTFTIYFFVIRFLRWPWRLPGAAAVGLLAATSQAYGVDKSTVGGAAIYLIIVVVNVAVALAYTWSRWHTECAVDQLSQANRRLETTLAENAGLQQQLLASAREAGVVEERQRMAREIHDTLAQGLTGIITQLQAAEQAADDPAGWHRHFDAATGLARESLSEARRSVEALRPEPLETGRLSEALAGVAGRWSALHGIPAQVTTTGTARPMPHQAEFALLRTAQEALANVARHAAATRVGVTLSYMEHEVALDVRDDGCGFDPALLCAASPSTAASSATAGFPATAGSLATASAQDRARLLGRLSGAAAGAGYGPVSHANGSTIGLVGLTVGDGLRPAAESGQQGGFGLVAMRQRIESLDGSLQVESEPGFGTGISACIPVPQGEL